MTGWNDRCAYLSVTWPYAKMMILELVAYKQMLKMWQTVASCLFKGLLFRYLKCQRGGGRLLHLYTPPFTGSTISLEHQHALWRLEHRAAAHGSFYFINVETAEVLINAVAKVTENKQQKPSPPTNCALLFSTERQSRGCCVTSVYRDDLLVSASPSHRVCTLSWFGNSQLTAGECFSQFN